MRFAAYECVWKNLVVFAHHSVAVDRRVVRNYRSRADFYRRANVGICADFDSLVDFRAFFYDSRFMNISHNQILRSFVGVDNCEHQFRRRCDFPVNFARTLGTDELLSAGLRDFYIDLDLVAWFYRLAEFYFVRAHKVRELVLPVDMP